MSRFQYILILFPLWLLNAQDSYIGPIAFDYSGDQVGVFESVIFDTIPSGGALTAANSDSIWIIISALNQTAPDTFDLFIALMQDTVSQVHPRSWSITESEPENIDFLMIYVPGIDSTFINQFSTFFPDSSTTADTATVDSMITIIIQELMDDVYVSIAGDLVIETATDTTFSGSFYGTFLKGEVTWPLPQINISNGTFSVNKATTTSLDILEFPMVVPELFSLDPPYPNPFNSSTILRFNVPKSEYVSLDIYDISGRHMETLIQKHVSQGKHSIKWNAHHYSSGIYFALLQTQHQSITQKVYLLK